MPIHPLVQKLNDDFTEAKAVARQVNALSQEIFLEEIFRKSLILSAASLFESRISSSLLSHAKAGSGGSECIVSLIKIKAIDRQFHTYFDWPGGNANTFLRLLGEPWRDLLKAELKTTPLKDQLNAFLELGQLRNLLVHENFASFPCEKTSFELIQLYEKAEGFVSRIELLLGPAAVTSHSPSTSAAP